MINSKSMTGSGAMRRVIGVGAGPRNVAIAVANNVLRAHNLSDCTFEIFEPSEVGANWRGNSGYTDGVFPLDTMALKDLTFPGRTGYGDPIDREVENYSFIRFYKETRNYERWVSAGAPAIAHRTFAEYLVWASERAEVPVHRARVTSITIAEQRTMLAATPVDAGAPYGILADGVVLSGPGEPRRVAVQDEDPQRIFDARTYWANRPIFKKLGNERVAVLGSGQSAGTIAKSLLTENSDLKVHVFNRFGFLPSQSAGSHENAMCSDPDENWLEIPLAERRHILERINYGVIDPSTKGFLDAQQRLRVVRGMAARVESTSDTVRITLTDGRAEEFDRVVVAIGFDPIATIARLLDDRADPDWLATLRASSAVDHQLRLQGIPANIHVPSLAGLTQGPGLALLSCLGTMALRVLSAYRPTAYAVAPLREMEATLV